MPAGFKHGRTIEVGPYTWRNLNRGALDLFSFDGVAETNPATYGLTAETTPNNPDGIFKTETHVVEETQATPADDTSGELNGIFGGLARTDPRDPYGTWAFEGGGNLIWGLRCRVFVLARSPDEDEISIAIYKDGVQETTPVTFDNLRWKTIDLGEVIPDLFANYTLRAWGGTSHLSSTFTMTRSTFFDLTDTNEYGADVSDTEALSTPVVEFTADSSQIDNASAGILCRFVPTTLEPSCEGDQISFGVASKNISDNGLSDYEDYEDFVAQIDFSVKVLKGVANALPGGSDLFHIPVWRTWTFQYATTEFHGTGPFGNAGFADTLTWTDSPNGLTDDDVGLGDEFQYGLLDQSPDTPDPEAVHRLGLGYFCQSVDDPFYNDYPDSVPFDSDFDLAWDVYESGGFVFNDFDHYVLRVFEESTLVEEVALAVDPATSPTTLNPAALGLSAGLAYRFVLSAVYSDGSFGWDSVVISFVSGVPQIYRLVQG